MKPAKAIRAMSAAVGIAALAVSGIVHAPAHAQDAQPAKKAAPPNKAEQSLNRGIAAYKKDALARAVGAFSSALSSGGLDTSGTARALYYRGLAYRKQGRTALAITDLTNALWLNNGLNETERADATANRAAAYQTAGIADPGAPQATPAAGAVTAAATSAAANPGAPQSAPAKPQPGAPTTTAAIAPPKAEPAPAAAPAANPLSGIGSFFGNLFSGGGSSGSDQQAAPAPAPAAAPAAGTGSAISAWNSNTQVEARAQPAPAPARTAALKPPKVTSDAAPAASAAPLKGKYKLQVAAVRSRAEAEQLAQRFASEYGSKLGSRTPAIEEAVFGNMGTFYRVNVGPYASAAEPDKLCQSVRGSGYDCLVVTH